jgi:hypothetical protein
MGVRMVQSFEIVRNLIYFSIYLCPFFEAEPSVAQCTTANDFNDSE